MKELSIKEIEDEKIIKHLITLFKHEYGENSNARFAGIKVKDIIAWLGKQGEQKSYASETMNEKEDFDSGFTRMIEKEQKHTEWSDEDNLIQMAALEILMASPKTVAFTILKESVIVWFKSLKDRVQSQPKQDSTDRFFEGFKKGEQSVLENYGKYGLCKLTE